MTWQPILTAKTTDQWTPITPQQTPSQTPSLLTTNNPTPINFNAYRSVNPAPAPTPHPTATWKPNISSNAPNLNGTTPVSLYDQAAGRTVPLSPQTFSQNPIADNNPAAEALISKVFPAAPAIAQGIQTGNWDQYNQEDKNYRAAINTPAGILSIMPGEGGGASEAIGSTAKTVAQSAFQLGKIPAKESGLLIKAAERIDSGTHLTIPDWETFKSIVTKGGYQLPKDSYGVVTQKNAARMILDARDNIAEKLVDPALTAAVQTPWKPSKLTDQPVQDTIKRHLASGQQILDTVPNAYLPEVLQHTKTNIVDGLRQEGRNGAANAAEAIDLSKIKSLDQFQKALNPQPRDAKGLWTQFKTALGGNMPNKQGGFVKLGGGEELPKPPTEAPAPVSSPNSTTQERGFITSTKELYPDLAPKLEGEYTPRSTDQLAIGAKNLIADNPMAAEKLARTGTDDKAVATASQLIKKYNVEAEAATDLTVKHALQDKAAAVANESARNLTEAGRTVQAASILGKLTPEGQVRFAAREIQKFNAKSPLAKQIPELTAEQAKDIHKEATDLFNMPDGEAKAIAYQKLQDKIAKLVPTPLMSKITSVWKAGLLTGIKTSGLNIASNASHAVSEILKDVPAAAVDSITSLATGKRSLVPTVKGTGEGTVEGFKRGWQYFKTGYDVRDIGAKLDFKKVNFGDSPFAKAIQSYEETIFHTLGAEDQPFYYGAKARSLASQAIAQAKNEGLAGAERAARVTDLVKNPTDDMLKYATIDAETSVFQNKTAIGTAAKSVQNIPGVGQFIAPFTRTPASVATQMINYSPVGIAKTIIENAGKGNFDQRLFSQGIGRGLTGTAIGYIGMQLFKKGQMSLGYPTTEKEQKQWQLEGRSANSIKIDGQWRSANVLGPAGMTLIAAGYVQQAMQKSGSLWEALTQASAGLGKTITDQTFLKGVQGLIQAISDPVQSATG